MKRRDQHLERVADQPAQLYYNVVLRVPCRGRNSWQTGGGAMMTEREVS